MAMLPSKRPRHTARGIVVHKGQILFMERWRDSLHYFSLPGGKIEANEAAPDALEREILEETTVIVEVGELVIEMRDGPLRHYIYECNYVDGEPRLPATAPERRHGKNNRFKPAWQPVERLTELPFLYWEPIRQPLISGLQNGFPKEPTIVTAS